MVSFMVVIPEEKWRVTERRCHPKFNGGEKGATLTVLEHLGQRNEHLEAGRDLSIADKEKQFQINFFK